MSQARKPLAGYWLLGALALAVSIDLIHAHHALAAGPQERVQATLKEVSVVLEDPTLQGAKADQER